MATSVGASDPTQNERMPFRNRCASSRANSGCPEFEQRGRTPCGQRLNDILARSQASMALA